MAQSFGIDLTTATAYNYGTDYSGYFETPLYIVGNYNNKRIFSEIEIQFAKELATGEGIQISYRVNLTDSFTTIKKKDGTTLTLTYAVLGAITTHIVAADIPACDMIQIRVALLGTTTTTPQLRQIILR